MTLPKALKEWDEGQTFSMKAETEEECILKACLVWILHCGAGVARNI